MSELMGAAMDLLACAVLAYGATWAVWGLWQLIGRPIAKHGAPHG